MAQHALLSASSASRWLHCTPAPIAESIYPDESSEYAEEGTLAHAMGAKKIKQALGLDTSGEDEEIAQLYARYYAPEMDIHTDRYASYVLKTLERRTHVGERAEAHIESRLDFSEYVPEGFGTGDATVMSDGTMDIIDLKYGKGVKVSAELNPQMRLYALGALDAWEYAYDVRRVRMTIYQPRIGNVSVWMETVESLREWAEKELRPLAQLAFRGAGDRHAGKWCRFCKAKENCMEFARQRAADAAGDFAGIEFE